MAQAVVVLIGAADWTTQTAAQLGGAFTPLLDVAQNGYVARLVDEQAALILIDANGCADWRFFTTTPKSSPATRRIPVIVAAHDPLIQREALTAGANLALSPAEMAARLPDLVSEMARRVAADEVERLAQQCGEPLPAEGLRAVDLFNAGEYYRQHDTFEALWVEEEGPVRDLYRSILQVGVAYYQIKRGNQRGALKMLLRSVQWLALLPEVCQGVDVARLRDDAAAVRAELERVGEDGMDQFDMSLLKPVRLVDAR